MPDQYKTEIVSKMISNYYEFLYSSDSVRNSAVLEALVSDIDVVLSYYPENTDDCSCGGECHNCVE